MFDRRSYYTIVCRYRYVVSRVPSWRRKWPWPGCRCSLDASAGGKNLWDTCWRDMSFVLNFYWCFVLYDLRTVLQNGEITTDEVTSNIPNTINIKNNGLDSCSRFMLHEYRLVWYLNYLLGMSPTLKPNDTRKTTRRSGIATPQKPAVGKEPEEESASGSPGTVSSMGTSGRSRSLRGSHPPDKEKKESTGRGNKR